MNFPAAFCIASAVLGLAIAGLVFSLARAAGWEDQRPLGWVALTASLSTAFNLNASLPLDPALGLQLARFQLFFITVHLAAWHLYANVLLPTPPWLARLPGPFSAAVAVAWLVPGALVGDRMLTHTVPWLGWRYQDPVITPWGDAAMAVLVVLALALAARFAVAWRRGVASAGPPCLGLLVSILMGGHDALVTSGVLVSPYLLDFGHLVPIAAVAWSLLRRFAADAAALRELRAELEAKVARRSQELAGAEEALLRAEKLAALGQLAAGIAHELNNPTAAVAANLEYVEDQLRAGGPPGEALEAVAESRASVERITRTVRELLDSGRAALSSPEERTPVSLAAVAEAAVRAGQARFGNRVRLADLVPSSLHVLGEERALSHVVGHLVANGVQAIPPGKRDGQVVLRGEREGDRVRLWVEDNGAGISEETLRRIFEPYFSTRAFGAGAGLGLAVSRGLIASLGGELRLESRLGHGTRAVLELEACEPRPRSPGESGSFPMESVPGARRRLLVIDDEPTVLTSLRRLLGRRYEVVPADGVAEGLRQLEAQPFDLVLCDLMMADGGCVRLHAELSRRSPGLLPRLVVLTGGAASPEARRFLDDRSLPVLEKPFEAEELASLEVRLRGERAPAAPIIRR